MSPALTALLIALLIVFLILFLKIKIIIEYKDEVALTVCIYGIPIRILPIKKRRVKPMSAKKAAQIRERRRKIAEQKARKKAERAKKKAEKKRKAAEKKKRLRASPKERRKEKRRKQLKKERRATLEENLDLIKSILSFFFSRLFGHLRIDVTRIRIIIGSDEASKTAITYGIAVQSVAYILALLDKVSSVHGLKSRDVVVDADFLSEETKVDIKIAFSIRLWHIFHLAFGSLRRLTVNRFAVRRRVARMQAAKKMSKRPSPPKEGKNPS